MATETVANDEVDCPDGISDDEEDYVDPRIQNELDMLNLASTEINRLENELDEARTKYRSIVSSTSAQMELVANDRKKSIHKAREYYRLLTESKLAQSEALKAARQFQSAVGIYKAAKETVALAETSLCEEATHAAAQLSSAWQETLNHAISKVMAAEKDKAHSEEAHKRRAAKFAELEARKQVLEKKFSKSIKRARPYFELKAELDLKLMQQKQNVIDLQAAIKGTKIKYTASLRKLESISEEIHQIRREKLWAKIPRMPGVGADDDSVISGMSEFDLKSLVSCGSESIDDPAGTDEEEESKGVIYFNAKSATLNQPHTEHVYDTIDAETTQDINGLTTKLEETERVGNLETNGMATDQTERQKCHSENTGNAQCLTEDNNDKRNENQLLDEVFVSKQKPEEDTRDKPQNTYLHNASTDGELVNNGPSVDSRVVQELEGINRLSGSSITEQTIGANSVTVTSPDQYQQIHRNDRIATSDSTNEHLTHSTETENGDYGGVDMKNVERPSLSGEE